MQLVMFDIDGTLVDTAGLDGDLYAAAVRSVLGVEHSVRFDDLADHAAIAALLGI
jgi:phosphoglycolate phosphatase-like HAD superfamily hydrolase